MKYLLMLIIKFYRKFISPMLPPSCRFYPTCSEYSLESIKKFGAFYGAILSVKRIARCNPFHKGGFDPVPENISRFNFKTFKFDKNK